MAVFLEQGGDNQQRDDRKSNQQTDFPFRRRIGENAERSAWIFGVNDAEKSGNDGNTVVQGKMARDRNLSDSIESDNQQRD